MISSLASLLDAKAKATPEKVVPFTKSVDKIALSWGHVAKTYKVDTDNQLRGGVFASIVDVAARTILRSLLRWAPVALLRSVGLSLAIHLLGRRLITTSIGLDGVQVSHIGLLVPSRSLSSAVPTPSVLAALVGATAVEHGGGACRSIERWW